MTWCTVLFGEYVFQVVKSLDTKWRFDCQRVVFLMAEQALFLRYNKFNILLSAVDISLIVTTLCSVCTLFIVLSSVTES